MPDQSGKPAFHRPWDLSWTDFDPKSRAVHVQGMVWGCPFSIESASNPRPRAWLLIGQIRALGAVLFDRFNESVEPLGVGHRAPHGTSGQGRTLTGIGPRRPTAGSTGASAFGRPKRASGVVFLSIGCVCIAQRPTRAPPLRALLRSPTCTHFRGRKPDRALRAVAFGGDRKNKNTSRCFCAHDRLEFGPDPFARTTAGESDRIWAYHHM